MPGINARGLRDMENPGTAYDDPALGKDPQPAHMDDFVRTRDDNGGVHINSGIPNRAFVLAARAIGGTSAEGAGRIWYAALTSGDVGTDADFVSFAAATVAAAGDHADAVREAWQQVGVGAGAGAGAGAPAASTAGRHGRRTPQRRDRRPGRRGRPSTPRPTTSAPARCATCSTGSTSRSGAAEGSPQPDRYVYSRLARRRRVLRGAGVRPRRRHPPAGRAGPRRAT